MVETYVFNDVLENAAPLKIVYPFHLRVYESCPQPLSFRERLSGLSDSDSIKG